MMVLSKTRVRIDILRRRMHGRNEPQEDSRSHAVYTVTRVPESKKAEYFSAFRQFTRSEKFNRYFLSCPGISRRHCSGSDARHRRFHTSGQPFSLHLSPCWLARQRFRAHSARIRSQKVLGFGHSVMSLVHMVHGHRRHHMFLRSLRYARSVQDRNRND